MARKKNHSTAAPMICGSEEVPVKFRQLYYDIVRLTDEFCNERLDVEYQQVCRELAICVCQEGTPALRGKRESWACGIVYTVGWINFLGDRSFEPYIRSEEIADWFGVSTATMHSKAKILREGLDIVAFEPEFTVPSLLDRNPLVWIIDLNGVFVDVRTAPRELQEAAFKQGVIPYIPADRGTQSEPYQVVHHRVQRSELEQVLSDKPTGLAYELTVNLKYAEPRVWRRLRVTDCTLEDLHFIIQDSMGWEECHMHEFKCGNERFVSESFMEFDELEEDMYLETEVLLSALVAAGHSELEYCYDFGDDWEHTIKIEKTLELSADDLLPVCIEGGGACPPEDIGGVPGYALFLEAIADPQHEMHEEYREWVGEDFDPNIFDLDEVNAILRES